jgi:hypothetical protein
VGIILSIIMIAAGADLAWGRDASVSGTGPQSAGFVLIGAGLVWVVLSLMVSSAYRDRERRSDAQRVVHLRGARPATQERRGQAQPPTVLGR